MMTQLHDLPQPVIAKVHGVATAAGCQLVAACDLAVAADDARFATPGVNIGLFCSTPMVPVQRAVGRKRALEMLLTGEMIDARTALDWGLSTVSCRPASSRPRSSRSPSESRQASAYVVALGKRAFYAQDALPEDAAYDLACAVMVDNALDRRRARRHACVPREAGSGVAESLAGVPGTRRRRHGAFAPFRHHAYARLWSGAFVSNIGTWMEPIALGIYVQESTHQAAWTGAVAAAAFVPIAFFGPLGGALADRFPRKALLITTTLVQMRAGRAAHVLFVAGQPVGPARHADRVRERHLRRARLPRVPGDPSRSRSRRRPPGRDRAVSAQYNLGRVVGPALAGIVIGRSAATRGPKPSTRSASSPSSRCC